MHDWAVIPVSEGPKEPRLFLLPWGLGPRGVHFQPRISFPGLNVALNYPRGPQGISPGNPDSAFQQPKAWNFRARRRNPPIWASAPEFQGLGIFPETKGTRQGGPGLFPPMGNPRKIFSFPFTQKRTIPVRARVQPDFDWLSPGRFPLVGLSAAVHSPGLEFGPPQERFFPRQGRNPIIPVGSKPGAPGAKLRGGPFFPLEIRFPPQGEKILGPISGKRV